MVRICNNAVILAFGAALALSGCAARGPSDDPVVRSLTWFSYLGAEDIEARCRAGGPDRYRFVYNGLYEEQIRAYDLVRDAGGGGYLQARVRGRVELTRLDVRDIFAPWRGDRAESLMAPADMARVDAALAASGFESPTPRGLRLRSDGFYWVAAACRGGQFHFNAWTAPSVAFDGLRFPAVLFDYDRTGVAPNPPRAAAMGPFDGRAGRVGGPEYPPFMLEVGDRGLKLGPGFR